MLATNPQKSDFENNTKKTPKTEGPGTPRDSPEMRSWGPLIYRKQPCPGYNSGKHALTASAVADIYMAVSILYNSPDFVFNPLDPANFLQNFR